MVKELRNLRMVFYVSSCAKHFTQLSQNVLRKLLPKAFSANRAKCFTQVFRDADNLFFANNFTHVLRLIIFLRNLRKIFSQSLA